MRLSIVTSAVVAALVGFGSTIAIIIAAAQAVGADRGPDLVLGGGAVPGHGGDERLS